MAINMHNFVSAKYSVGGSIEQGIKLAWPNLNSYTIISLHARFLQKLLVVLS